MFQAKAKMTVSAEDVEITSVGQMAVVRMRQTFAQAKFKDTGDKQLVVVSTKDGLRIAREEMLASSLVDRKAEVPPGMVVIHDAAGAWMILGDASDAETTGNPSHGGGGEGFDYSTHTKLADKHALVGDEVTLYPSGTTCKIADISVMSMLTPHFGTSYEWRGDEDGDGQAESKPLSEREIDAEVAGGGAQHLAADVSGCAGGADDVVGMLAPGAPWREASPSSSAPLFAAFEQLDEWRAIQAEFADSGASGEWTASLDALTEISSFSGPDGRELVAVSARAGDGCGEFEGSLVAIFEVKAGKVVRHALAPEMPEAIVDLDADGEPELVSKTAVYVRDGDAYTETVTVDLGYRDCPC